MSDTHPLRRYVRGRPLCAQGVGPQTRQDPVWPVETGRQGGEDEDAPSQGSRRPNLSVLGPGTGPPMPSPPLPWVGTTSVSSLPRLLLPGPSLWTVPPPGRSLSDGTQESRGAPAVRRGAPAVAGVPDARGAVGHEEVDERPAGVEAEGRRPVTHCPAHGSRPARWSGGVEVAWRERPHPFHRPL